MYSDFVESAKSYQLCFRLCLFLLCAHQYFTIIISTFYLNFLEIIILKEFLNLFGLGMIWHKINSQSDHLMDQKTNQESQLNATALKLSVNSYCLLELLWRGVD